jgi:hypothetical protein
MSETSDKEMLAMDAERVLAAARDSLSDEMVGRLAGTASDAMDLIDRINRTGLYKAIPAIAELVNNGDLDRLARLARVYGSAEDALSDEMIGRIAETAAEGISLLDRLSRGGAGRLVELLTHLETSGDLHRIAVAIPKLIERLDTLEDMLHGFDSAGAVTAKQPRSAGGFGSLWAMMRDPENQDALRFLINLGKEMQARAGKPRR